jgi:hypothetical protein
MRVHESHKSLRLQENCFFFSFFLKTYIKTGKQHPIVPATGRVSTSTTEGLRTRHRIASPHLRRWGCGSQWTGRCRPPTILNTPVASDASRRDLSVPPLHGYAWAFRKPKTKADNSPPGPSRAESHTRSPETNGSGNKSYSSSGEGAGSSGLLEEGASQTSRRVSARPTRYPPSSCSRGTLWWHTSHSSPTGNCHAAPRGHVCRGTGVSRFSHAYAGVHGGSGHSGACHYRCRLWHGCRAAGRGSRNRVAERGGW